MVDLLAQTEGVRLLLIDDDPVARVILARKLLQRRFLIREAPDGASGLEVIRSNWPQAVLLDYLMPGLDGLAVLREIRATPENAELPVVFLTALDQPQMIVEAFDQGADDYMGKPVHPDEVSVRLVRLLRLAERRRTLARAATFDGLTGLLNRRGLDEVAENLIGRSRQQGDELACCLFDLDRFKHVNDTFGHMVGDHILVETARRLRACLRPSDLTARYGGEELAALLPGASSEGALIAAERVRQAIGGTPFTTTAGPVPVTVSGGVAVLSRTHGGWYDLLGRADDALYAAKAAGRNRVALANTIGEAPTVV